MLLTGDCVDETAAALSSVTASLTSFSPSDNGDSLNAVVAADATVALAPSLAAASDPLTSPSARTQFRALAEQTGGVFFQVSRAEVDSVVPILLELGDPGTGILAARRVQLTAGTSLETSVVVDDTLTEQVTFMISATRAQPLPTFTLIRPDGIEALPGDPDVTQTILSSVESLRVTTPATGEWKIRLEGDGEFLVRAFGLTPLHVAVFSFSDPSLPPVRPEVDVMPLEGQPVPGAALIANFDFAGTPQDVSVVLRQLDGTLIENLTATQATTRRFKASFNTPAGPFIIEATGMTQAGNPFARQIELPIFPQNVLIRISPNIITGVAGDSVNIFAEVTNAGSETGTFGFNMVSTLGWPTMTPDPVMLEAGESATVLLTAAVPLGTLEGTQNEFTIFVENIDRPTERNSASLQVIARELSTDEIDNDLPVTEVGSWRVQIRAGGESRNAWLTAVGTPSGTQFNGTEIIFDYFSYVDIGDPGGAFQLSSSVTAGPTIVNAGEGSDVMTSSGSFIGENGNVIDWNVDSVIEDNSTTMLNFFTFTAQSGEIGRIRLWQYLDEDVLGFSDDVFFVRGSSTELNLDLFTVDNNEAIGVSHTGALSAEQGLLNSNFMGYAACRYNLMASAIVLGSQPVSLSGELCANLTAVPINHPVVGAAFGPIDVVSSLAWDVDPTATTATVITILGGVPIAPELNAAPICTAARPSTSKLWPPNHEFIMVGVLDVTDPDNDPVSITITAITQDEPVNEIGDGNTALDGEGVGTPTAKLRAERSGTGDGRVYAIQFKADDGNGGICDGIVNVGVPHNIGEEAIDSGQAFDSTQ